MAVAVSGNLCSCLFRYLVLAFLASSVIYTTSSLLFNVSSEDIRKNAAGFIQRSGAGKSLSSLIDIQSPTFEVESIKYSQQKMVIPSASRHLGKKKRRKRHEQDTQVEH